ncbi:coiled-coil domain-containing protein 47-like protein [Dinothrombium tinctorium]|uniref:PAT complex subunit CCDC47 n=1 Tax=Dinothrombium tinctorium TaxID=1965070 RepID=A0A3S3PAS4_9ACAR|nr:coiled-coil domain-containing protein 47-like protein [Dinothrombium tinctorium]
MITLLKRSKRCKLFSCLLSISLLLALILEMCAFGVNAAVKVVNSEFMDDNEFAEFEEFDDEDEALAKKAKAANTAQHTKDEASTAKSRDSSPVNDENEATVEDDDEYEEFDILKDSEEFEMGADSDGERKKASTTGGAKTGDLKITKVPLHLRSSWESYYLEFLMIAGLFVYFLNFMTGRNKNQRLANAWLNAHRELLESNFALVGDDGKKEIENHGLVKETENIFTLWCSGRVCVEGMLVELKFIKRQDLVNTISSMMKPSMDQIIVKVFLNADAMDAFVFCVANKKTALKLVKEMNDISTYCPERKAPDKFGVSGDTFVLMNEIGEVASVLFDSKVVSLLNKYDKCIDYIHISDQFSGPKLPEETQIIKLPEVKKIMIFAFSCHDIGKVNAENMEAYKPLMQLVFYMLEKVKKFRLSKEGKLKSDKNRQRVEEIFLKATHAQRQEAAQAKREERRRAEKERILNEEDPEKQRKWEEREHRREMKKKAPKMKQLKVKAL